MKIRVRFGWLVVLSTICLITIAWLSGRAGIEKRKRADTCVQCGAEKIQSSTAFCFFNFRLPINNTTSIQPTSLTKCWARYATPCQHDWALNYINTKRGLSVMAGDGFPSYQYPAASAAIAKDLVAGVEWLDMPNERSNVLTAIGSRDNLLRFVAARTLVARAESEEKNPSSWWAIHSKYFVVVTNKEAATKLLDSWEPNTSDLISVGIEECRELIRRAP